MRKSTIVAILLLSALSSILPPPAHAQWMQACGWDQTIQAYTCHNVWWPYYAHLTTQPDFCMWQNGDTVWLKWDANYQNVIGWYGVPAADLTTQPPSGYEQHNYTVVNCGLVP